MSGGVDSSTLAILLQKTGYDVYPITFLYGSSHNKYEIEKLYEFLSHNNMKLPLVFNLETVFRHSHSSLMTGEIPEGHYEAENMRSTVVPGRNLVFISIMASIAESKNYDGIAIGVHAGDHHIYPDCRPDFVREAKRTVILSSDKKIELLTPFVNCTKTEIIQIGLDYQIDYSKTRTCYKDQVTACGKCGSCVERLEAFEQAGVKDPIEYEA